MSGQPNPISPEMIQALLAQQGNQMPPEQGMQGDMPMQGQFDPQMLASLLRGNKMQMPPGVPTVGIRG